ncbi:MAG: AraC family transcriptional regulator [Acidovorax sp.]|nr:AraC family transcriptional regulator [Acidovorax sp.]
MGGLAAGPALRLRGRRPAGPGRPALARRPWRERVDAAFGRRRRLWWRRCLGRLRRAGRRCGRRGGPGPGRTRGRCARGGGQRRRGGHRGGARGRHLPHRRSPALWRRGAGAALLRLGRAAGRGRGAGLLGRGGARGHGRGARGLARRGRAAHLEAAARRAAVRRAAGREPRLLPAPGPVPARGRAPAARPLGLGPGFRPWGAAPRALTCATLEFEGGSAHPLARALPPLTVLPLARLPELDHTLALLFAETGGLLCGQRLLADRLFEVLLMQILRWLLAHPEAGGVDAGLLRGLAHPALARALTAVHEAPGAAWTLERMAQHAGMSRSAFAQAFKREVGETPADYLARWRLAIAQAELRRGRALKTLAPELGYANASALSRVFVQRLGQAPRAWLAAQA